MKKAISILLCLVLLLGIFAVCASADDTVDTRPLGGDVFPGGMINLPELLRPLLKTLGEKFKEDPFGTTVTMIKAIFEVIVDDIFNGLKNIDWTDPLFFIHHFSF
ncbi:MAG: hypothetical protein II702_01250 [Clostridia bacterium]|nr:hypothetical protein [Clostridia bacterium]